MALSYARTTWADGSDGGTAITATRLNNMESGISNATTQINTNTTNIATLKDSVSHITTKSVTSDSVTIASGAGVWITVDMPTVTGAKCVGIVGATSSQPSRINVMSCWISNTSLCAYIKNETTSSQDVTVTLTALFIAA
jgi:hypothetical protein